jgi:hypothetical protein
MGEAHQGIKASRVKWLGNSNLIATTGFSKMRDRQFGIWDATNMSSALEMKNIDASTGVLDIFYDNDSSLLFLAGKGDGGVRVFEISKESPYASELPPGLYYFLFNLLNSAIE